MKAKKNWILVTIAGTLCMAILWTSKAMALSKEKTAILKNVALLHVEVSELPPEVEKAGLTKRQLQTDVELKLRQAGIHVFSKDDAIGDLDKLLGGSFPTLVVYVPVVHHDSFNVYAFHAAVFLTRSARLASDPNVYINRAVVWTSPGTIGILPPNKVREIKDFALGQVNEFINDYLAANPPQPAKKGEDKEQGR